MRAMARDVNQRIIADAGAHDSRGLRRFTRASQNIATLVALLERLPMDATPEGRHAHDAPCTLLERAAVQQAESSLS